MSEAKRPPTGAAIREKARARLLEKDLKSDENSATKDTLSTTKESIIDFEKKGFDPLRYHIEEGSQDWAAKSDPNKALVISASQGDCGEEMLRLCDSLGFESGEKFLYSDNAKIHAATFIGPGKLPSIRSQLESTGCGVVVFDAELSPSQARNLEKELKVPVVDRQFVILQIFKNNAQSSLAKLQVEAAEIKYFSARLSGLWMGLSRQRGAKGGVGGRGQGETFLELDRRTLKRRISIIAKKLKKAKVQMQTQSSRRKGFPRIALVGYTNAGKSTLMNRLTQANLLSEDRLFATLDTTVRAVEPPTDPKILMSDTVGFINHIPHDLVASFESTLAESISSDLLFVVVDASSEDAVENVECVYKVLGDIGATKIPKFLLLNKSENMTVGALKLLRMQIESIPVDEDFKLPHKILSISALEGRGMKELREAFLDNFNASFKEWVDQDRLN